MAVGDVLGFIKNRPGNLLINGGMDFNQRRNSSIGMDATPAYRVQDRFLTYTTVNTDWNTRNQDVGSLTDSQGIVWKALDLDLDAANSNAVAYIEQRIEASSVYYMVGKKASFSVEFVNPGFTDLTIKLYYANAEDDHSTQTLIVSKSETFVADSTLKNMKFENISIPANAKNGIAIVLEVSGVTVGSLFTNSFSKMMFNEGPVVAPFERAGVSIANEIQLCQRYYEKSYNLDTAPGTVDGDGMRRFRTASAHFCDTVYFQVRKRVNPTGTYYSPATGASGNIGNKTTASDSAVSVGLASEAALATNGGVGASVGDQFQYHWTADAEL